MRTFNFIAPLFVPANRPDRFAKVAALGADAIILDLEDAVAVSEKDKARIGLQTDFTEPPIFIRINAVGTPWHEVDIATASRLRIAGIMCPKSEVDGGCPGARAGAKYFGAVGRIAFPRKECLRMKVLFSVKQVADSNVKVKVKSGGLGVNLENVKMNIHPALTSAVSKLQVEK